MIDIESEYQNACSTTSDINQHLPMLRLLSDQCAHVTEMGVRWGNSSRAFLSSSASAVRMYDLTEDARVRALVDGLIAQGRDVIYTIADVLAVKIEPTDFLFIDTLHTYKQLVAELETHADSVAKFIAFHDTHLFGLSDEPGHGGPGLLPAILEFLASHPAWRVKYHTTVNNGLTVIERH